MTRTTTIAAILLAMSTHGQYHQLPPPVNIVGAGFNMEFASQHNDLHGFRA